ncbi:helix-turn-helix domain-containing protein [Geodermatophilus ruber]|nr:hypothetical protein [Geodermatophilus ruber]
MPSSSGSSTSMPAAQVHGFDDQTELLTDQGWKALPQVTGEERALTLNGDVAEWAPITGLWRHAFDGYLNLHDGDRVNFAVTASHLLLVRGRETTYRRHSRLTVEDGEAIKEARRRGVPQAVLAARYGVSVGTIGDVAHGRRDGKLRTGAVDAPRWQLRPYTDLPEHFKVRRTNIWAGSHPDQITFATPPRTPGYQRTLTFAFDDWAEFLGWYVAEGWTHTEARGSWSIGIAQKPGVKYEQIADLLGRMGIRYYRGALALTFHHKGLSLWLQEHCGVGSGHKQIPVSIKEAGADMIDVFLDAFGRGDGAVHTHEDSRRYITSSLQLANDLHEVLCKVGRGRKVRVMAEAGSASVMSTTGRAFTRRRATYMVSDPGVPVDSDVRKQNVTRVRYTGTVYCVATSSQSVMVRRQGCALWLGTSACPPTDGRSPVAT